MQKRIIKNNMISILIAAVMTVFICLTVLSNVLENTMQEQAYSQTMLVMRILEDSEDTVQTLESLKDEIYGRITFVNTEGDVVFDSDYDEKDLGSHADREEIIEANKRGIYMRQRISATTNRVTYYCAAQVKDKGVIRIGIMSSNMSWETIMTAGSALWLGISIITMMILLVSSFTTQRIVDNVEQYDLENGEGDIYPELSHFVNKIQKQNEIINKQLQTLKEEKTKLQSIFVNIKEGIIVCDSNHKIVQTNNEAKLIFNFENENSDFNSVIKVPELIDAVQGACKGETIHSTFELNERWYQSITSPSVYSSDIGVIIIVLDITQQIESERNRRQFTDNVTHELKTPLTSIYGYSQLITNDLAKKEDVKGFVKIIENNAAKLLEMIDDIIRISNMESGYGFMKEPLQLDEIIAKVVEQENFNARNSGVKLNVNTEPIEIMADESQMYQLVGNLVTNAIKYNREGGTVSVELFKDGEFAVLKVKDTGIGIPNDKLDQIFERFYVVDKSRNKNKSSTGLGLSIVKHVAKAHNGFVSVKSQLGKGTEFTVNLPLK